MRARSTRVSSLDCSIKSGSSQRPAATSAVRGDPWAARAAKHAVMLSHFFTRFSRACRRPPPNLRKRQARRVPVPSARQDEFVTLVDSLSRSRGPDAAQVDFDGGPDPDRGLQLDLTSHPLNQLLADGQPKPRPDPSGLGGEQGLENSLLELRWNSASVVFDGHPHPVAIGPPADADDARSAGAIQRLGCIDDQIEQDLAELNRSPDHLHRRTLDDELRTLLHLGARQLGGESCNVGEIGFGRYLVGARVSADSQRYLADVLGAGLDVVQYLRELFEGLLDQGVAVLLQMPAEVVEENLELRAKRVDVLTHVGDRVHQLVCNPGADLTNRRQALRAEHSRLDLAKTRLELVDAHRILHGREKVFLDPWLDEVPGDATAVDRVDHRLNV